jgi:hypothetical protein
MRRLGYLIALLSILAPRSFAATAPTCTKATTQGHFCKFLKDLISDESALAGVAADDVAGKAAAQLLVTSDLTRLVKPVTVTDAIADALSEFAAAGAFNKAVDDLETSRLDVQAGGTSGTSGSTDLVSRSGLTTLISAAYQIGAFTQTTSGNTATFHVNAGGFLKAVGHESVVSPTANATKGLSWNNLDGSVSVDMMNQSAGTTVPVSGSATGNQTLPSSLVLPSQGSTVSAVSVRYAIAAPFDPRSSKFLTAWNSAFESSRAQIQTAGGSLDAAAEQLAGDFNTLPASVSQPYRLAFDADAKAGDGVKLENDFETYFEKAVAFAQSKDPNFQDKLSAVNIALASFVEVNGQVLETARGVAFTLEGDYNHPAQQPETYTIKGIYAHSAGAALFTVNGSVTSYGTMPAGANYKRLRDGQVSMQFDTPLGDPKKSIATLTGAFYMQYQTDPSVLNITAGNLVPGTTITLPSNAQALLGPSGLIVIGQGKLTINTKSGIKIPLAVEYSNKTDLLNATDVRGNFGVSYDFSSFSSLFGAKPN